MPEALVPAVLTSLAALAIFTSLASAGAPWRGIPPGRPFRDGAGRDRAVTLLLAILGALAGLALRNPLAAVLLAGAAVLYRRRSLRLRQAARRALIDSQAETALQMVAALFETTGDLVRAIQSTAASVPPPLGDELRRVVADYRAGASLREAMLGLAHRTGNRDLDVFVRGVLLSERYGTNTPDVVRAVVELIRDRIGLREDLQNELRGQKLTISIFLAIIPVAGLALLAFSPQARYTMTQTLLGKVIVAALVAIEYAAWHITSGHGVVEDL